MHKKHAHLVQVPECLLHLAFGLKSFMYTRYAITHYPSLMHPLHFPSVLHIGVLLSESYIPQPIGLQGLKSGFANSFWYISERADVNEYKQKSIKMTNLVVPFVGIWYFSMQKLKFLFILRSKIKIPNPLSHIKTVFIGQMQTINSQNINLNIIKM